jgi:hypothetical protein
MSNVNFTPPNMTPSINDNNGNYDSIPMNFASYGLIAFTAVVLSVATILGDNYQYSKETNTAFVGENSNSNTIIKGGKNKSVHNDKKSKQKNFTKKNKK